MNVNSIVRRVANAVTGGYLAQYEQKLNSIEKQIRELKVISARLHDLGQQDIIDAFNEETRAREIR